MVNSIVIIGAGPAGLTAALEIIRKTDHRPIIIEANGYVGGLSSTHNFNGYLYDIGPHRFFTKSDRVKKVWLSLLPEVETDRGGRAKQDDKVMLKVARLTRILYLKRFFDYPVKPSFDTLLNLGPIRIVNILFSYLAAKIIPKREPKSLEDFFVQRFGRKLYELFFESYTQKVWGVACRQIPADWGRQRVKNLSVADVLKGALEKLFKPQTARNASLGDAFLYPKLGCGQIYQEMADLIIREGGQIHLNCKVVAMEHDAKNIYNVQYAHQGNGTVEAIETSHVFSSMPIVDLISSLGGVVPALIKEIASKLVYRDYIIVLMVYKKNKMNAELLDNWIYVQESDVKMARLDLFHNFSKALLNNSDTIWLGAEYFCTVNDEFWLKSDEDIQAVAISELQKLNICLPHDFVDGYVRRVEKAYPAYFGSYSQFDQVVGWLNGIENLFCIGRNGMHKYNNMDHSILSAMTAVDNLVAGVVSKDNIWAVNTEAEYHEQK